MHRPQREQTHALLTERGVDAALFASPASITWLTGFAPPVQTGANPFAAAPPLLWWADGKFTLLVVDGLAPLAAAFGDEEDGGVATYRSYTIDGPIDSARHLRDLLQALWSAHGRLQHIGIESAALPAAVTGVLAGAQGGAQWVVIDGWLAPLRMVKTDEELSKLRENFRLTDIGHAAARSAVVAGAREIDVWEAARTAVEQAAGCRVPMGNDCIVGYRQENIGGWPLDFALHDGDSIIVDLSTIRHGYWSDSCATYVAGAPDERQRTIHRVASEALALGAGLLRPGAVAGEIDRQVRAFIAGAGYAVYPHHTGHGVGVTGHEAPRLIPGSTAVLEAGMVILLEPGIYFPGETGVRVEDAFLIVEDGAQRLTTHDKSLSV